MKSRLVITSIMITITLVVSDLSATTFKLSSVIQDGDYYGVDDPVVVLDTPPDTTVIDMTGGYVYQLDSYDSSSINFGGGEIYYSNMHDLSMFSMDSSSVGINHRLHCYDSSNANISGGRPYYIFAHSTSTVNFSDNGTNHRLWSYDSSVVNISGGEVNFLYAYDLGVANLRGGEVGYILAAHSSEVNIFGLNLFATNTGGLWGYGEVAGNWVSGEAFAIPLYGVETYHHINLIPEPCTLLLLGLGWAMLRSRDRPRVAGLFGRR